MGQVGETGRTTTLNAHWTEASLSSCCIYKEKLLAWRAYSQRRVERNKEGGKQGKTFSVVKTMCACASLNRPRNTLPVPNTPVTELVVIDLAKSECRAGNWTY